MALLRRLYGRLRLTVNESKSAVADVKGRKFLGYCFWFAKDEVKRVRELIRRNGGRSMQEVIERLRPYLLGWKAYFGLAQTPGVWRSLNEWLRHRLRAIQLKHRKRGTTMYPALCPLGGARPAVVRRIAANSRRWWRNSGLLLNGVLDLAWFDRLGLPRLS